MPALTVESAGESTRVEVEPCNGGPRALHCLLSLFLRCASSSWSLFMVHDTEELVIPVSSLSTGWWACPLFQHIHPSTAHVVQRSGTNKPQSRAFMPTAKRNLSPRCTLKSLLIPRYWGLDYHALMETSLWWHFWAAYDTITLTVTLYPCAGSCEVNL